MTAVAQPSVQCRRLRIEVLLGTSVFALFVALAGIYWDVSWHATLGRDSFWIAPHLLIYAGVSGILLIGCGGLALVARTSGGLFTALHYAEGRGFALTILGTLLQIAAAPIDDMWHRRYGLDVTIWSPPHLMGIAGALVAMAGLAVVLQAMQSNRALYSAASGVATLHLLLWSAALTLALFTLGEMDFHREARTLPAYPLLAGLITAMVLLAATGTMRRRGTATAVALIYMLFRTFILLVIVAAGDMRHLTPPVFVLAPALVIDFVLWRTRSHGVLLATLLAGPTFLIAEWGYGALLGATWDFIAVVASITVVTVVVTLGGLAGDRLAAVLRGTEQL
jgi:hypothetical protein